MHIIRWKWHVILASGIVNLLQELMLNNILQFREFSAKLYLSNSYKTPKFADM